MSGTISGLVGPGTQPGEEDGAALEYMEMPKGMRTYAMPVIPEPEETQGVEPALEILDQLLKTLERQDVSSPSVSFDLTALDAQSRAFVDQVLGEGEVSIVAGTAVQAQESVLAGLWRVHEVDGNGSLLRDTIEVGVFPEAALRLARAASDKQLQPHKGPLPPGVLNSPALITELNDKVSNWTPGTAAHVINLTLLPQTEEDLAFLDQRLGKGPVIVLSRGYGNCRITSTATRNAWWVQYFNSREAIILNTIEVTDVPSVACAAQEDLEDSAQRLAEILEVYR